MLEHVVSDPPRDLERSWIVRPARLKVPPPSECSTAPDVEPPIFVRHLRVAPRKAIQGGAGY
eukprot:4367457-Pyramimonas_sp.AAC.1